MENIEQYKEEAALIEKISGIESRDNDQFFSYAFKITYRGRKKPSYIASESLKRYEDISLDVKSPVKFTGITLWHQNKKTWKKNILLNEREIEAQQKESYDALKKQRDSILDCFDEDERELIDGNKIIKLNNPQRNHATTFQLTGGCLASEHSWGEWTRYSGHEQRACYKCDEIMAIGFMDGQPVRQSYAATLSCGY